MIRTRLSDAALRPARNRPFATRGVTSETETPVGTETLKAPKVHIDKVHIELTPEEERICDRATD